VRELLTPVDAGLPELTTEGYTHGKDTENTWTETTGTHGKHMETFHVYSM